MTENTPEPEEPGFTPHADREHQHALDAVVVQFPIEDQELLREALGKAFADLFGTDPAPARPEPPRRGSPEYFQALETLGDSEDPEVLVDGCLLLWEDYGWRALLDLMALWIRYIEALPYTPSGVRDMFGVVALHKICAIEGDEGDILRLAAKSTEDVTERPHKAFGESVRALRNTFDSYARWKPYFQAAFTAAHQDPEDHRAVFAALARSPFKTDRKEVIRLADVLATAAQGVRRRQPKL